MTETAQTEPTPSGASCTLPGAKLMEDSFNTWYADVFGKRYEFHFNQRGEIIGATQRSKPPRNIVLGFIPDEVSRTIIVWVLEHGAAEVAPEHYLD